MNDDDQTYDLSDAAGAVRRRVLVVILVTVAFAGAALVVSLARPDRYEATAILLIRSLGLEQQITDAPVVPVLGSNTNIGLASLDQVADRAERALGGAESAAEISDAVTVRPGVASDLVEVNASAESAEGAAKIANTFARAFLEIRRSQDRDAIVQARRAVERDLERLPARERRSVQGDELRVQADDLRTLELLQTGGAELAEGAKPPDSSISSPPLRDMALGGFAGLIFGLAAALVLELLGPRLRSGRDFERAFGAPVLASVPVDARLGKEPLEPFGGEAFRTLWTRLRFLDREDPPRLILLVSARAGEGRTTIALQLALAGALAGSRVTVVEADLRRPELASRASLEATPGLTEIVSGGAGAGAATRSLPARAGVDFGIELITGGSPPASATAVLASRPVAELLETLSESRDLVLIDAPPIGEVADAIPLIGLVDGVLVVAGSGRLSRRDGAELRRRLDELGARVLGVVVNRSRGA